MVNCAEPNLGVGQERNLRTGVATQPLSAERRQSLFMDDGDKHARGLILPQSSAMVRHDEGARHLGTGHFVEDAFHL
jgi:hypothetical protein